MLKTLVGPEGFGKGADIYFGRNEGKAVTCEDWVQAIQDANPNVDLTVFRRWYNQSGTRSDEEFPSVPEAIINSFKQTLRNTEIDAALRTEVFLLPPESYITEQVEVADPVRIQAARKYFMKQWAENLQADLQKIFDEGVTDSSEYKLDPDSQDCAQRYKHDRCVGYFAYLSSSTSPEREIALEEFYEKWKSDLSVVEKWLAIQFTGTRDDVFDIVKGFTAHEIYSESVPNKVYALMRGYGSANVHIRIDGSGYKFLSEQVSRLDRMKPQAAARIAR
ncbi:Peptidase M1 [Gracilaria domingensis]|nr:Peptidase M1 [Gracilaria domingensis]